MKNPELLATLILSADTSEHYAKVLDKYKNVFYIMDAERNPVTLTIKGKLYNLVINFPTTTDPILTIKLLSTVTGIMTIEGLDSVTYRLSYPVSLEYLLKILRKLPNHANLILREDK